MYCISVCEKLKHKKPRKHQEPLDFLAYLHDQRLCRKEYLAEYIDRTEPQRENHKKLLINDVKPYQPVSKATVVRWIKEVLRVSGIDKENFTAHSCHTASTSSNKVAGV